MCKEDLKRCPWVIAGDSLYETYHDLEWGVPVYDDQKHFEFLILESAQAGLSWLTILRKRENYRRAFAQFDPQKVAAFTQEKVTELLLDQGIIRNRRKIESAITNARCFIQIQKEFGSFSKYIWAFVSNQVEQNSPCSLKEIPTQSASSLALSKDLKKRGFSFLGPKILYAHMQATGLVNDHTTDCYRYQKEKK